MADFDLVLRGGTILDGSGGAPFRADVAVRGDRIVEVGEVAGRGAQEIDARGCLVTPGFIDVHTHYDGQVTWENRLAPSSNHGVTRSSWAIAASGSRLAARTRRSWRSA